MTDIRPIKASEAEAFLDLMCTVFGLDFNRAYDVFFTEPFFDLNRKWALFEGREMISVLTTAPLEFGWGRAFGVAGVATRASRQREGYAGRLLEKVCREAERQGEPAALLFARKLELYERMGFEGIDRVVRGKIAVCDGELGGDTLDSLVVEDRYLRWSLEHPDRLRRNDLRWKYWNWHLRTCATFQDGYICDEIGSLREVICTGPVGALPLPVGTEWLGTSFMTDQLEIPLEDVQEEMILMGRNVPSIPQMFMTDQF